MHMQHEVAEFPTRDSRQLTVATVPQHHFGEFFCFYLFIYLFLLFGTLVTLNNVT